MAANKILHQLTEDLNLTIEEVEEKFDTNSKEGLDEHEAQNRLEDNGANYSASRSDSQPSQILLLLGTIIGIHNFPLWCGALLSFSAYLWENYVSSLANWGNKSDNLYISIGLFAFIIVFGVFSFYMDAKCNYYIEICQDLLTRQSTVIRDSITQIVKQESLVVGDLIVFNRGDEIAADIKLIESSGVKIYGDTLNETQQYFYTQLYGKFYPDKYFEKGDLIFNSTFIAFGHGKGIVMKTQNFYLSNTKFETLFPGSRKNANKKTSESRSSLRRQLDEFLHILSFISLSISIIYGVSIFFFGYSWLYAMMFFIAHYVGIITEALIPTFSVGRAQSAKKLAYRNCYLQNIDALETLGTTSVICTNKTGQITQNKMIVGRIWIHDQEMASFEFIKKYKGSILEEPVASFIRASALSVFAHFTIDNDTVTEISPFKRNAIGKPSEVALLRFMEAFVGESIELYQTKRYSRQFEMAFNCVRKCSYKVYKQKDTLLVAIKGEPEVLIDRSTLIMTARGLKAFSGKEKTRLLELCNDMGRKKYRILAISQVYLDGNLANQIYHRENGQVDLSKSLNIIKNKQLEFQFLGLMMLENPVRMTVPEAIFTCRRAGIKVILTTADHPQTSLAIAKTVGIVLSQSTINMEATNERTQMVQENQAKQLYTGQELTRMVDSKLKTILNSTDDLVFARISPDEKRRLVVCCRELNKVVTATGIGVADLGVFEQAHVSLSMGRYGTDIAKRHSDVILLDDNFATIVQGIREGRVLSENLKKSLCYTLSSKPVELLPYIFFLSFGIPKMAGPIVILAIDLITDNLPPIALGYEWAESFVMDESPAYFVEQKLVNFETVFISLFFYGIIQFTSGFFSYVIVYADNGFLFCDLIGIRRLWTNKAISDLEDSYGQEWTYQQRIELEQCSQTVYFITIVVTRIALLFSCRTRKDSCLLHLFSNSMVNFSVFFLLFFAVFLSYYSPFQYTVPLYPLKLSWWFLGVPFFLLIIFLEEMRKLIIRRYPKSSIAKIVYY